MSKTLDSKNWVVKQNALNEMRTYDMNLQELRLFSVYLSKISPKNIETRAVRFSLAEFQTIMELKSPNIDYFKKIAKSLLTKIVFEPLDSGGFDSYTIFNRFRVMQDKDGEWYIDVDANELALPLLFDFKGRYFKYELWNALQLKSKNQLRMYEILKQYEKPGSRVLSIEKLKEMLGIRNDEYPRFNTFKQGVLDVCQKALSENSDISFTYEPFGKKGRGGKVIELKFTIFKNENHQDKLFLGELINLDENESNDIDSGDHKDNYDAYMNPIYSSAYEERIQHLMSTCDNTFNREEMIVIYSLMAQKVPHIHFDEHESYDYLRHKYRELEANDSQLRKRGEKIENRYAYFKKMVENN